LGSAEVSLSGTDGSGGSGGASNTKRKKGKQPSQKDDDERVRKMVESGLTADVALERQTRRRTSSDDLSTSESTGPRSRRGSEKNLDPQKNGGLISSLSFSEGAASAAGRLAGGRFSRNGRSSSRLVSTETVSDVSRASHASLSDTRPRGGSFIAEDKSLAAMLKQGLEEGSPQRLRQSRDAVQGGEEQGGAMRSVVERLSRISLVGRGSDGAEATGSAHARMLRRLSATGAAAAIEVRQTLCSSTLCERARNLFYGLPMLEPLSGVRLLWELIVTVASVFALALMPLDWAFPSVWPSMATTTGSICCPIFLVHIAVKLRTALPMQGLLNRNPSEVARYYLSSSQAVTDLVAGVAFPIQALVSRHCTLLHLVALRHILIAIGSYERKLKLSHSARRVFVLALLSVVMMHWLSCAWSLLADPDGSIRSSLRGLPAGDAQLPESWYTLFQQTLPNAPPSSTAMIYLYSLYWTLATTTTIGFGDVLPANEAEIAVLCGTICVSAMLYSSLIAYMSNLILASDVNWTAHKQKVETVKSYMRHRKIPSELQTRIEEYLDYLWTTQKG
jgi:hypothetical protein